MEPVDDPSEHPDSGGAVRREVMTRTTPDTRSRALRRRAAQVALAGAVAAAPMGFAAAAAPAAHADTDWDAVAACESGGDWSINTGNGYGGGLQFTDSTWKAFGGSGQPEDASRSQQIQVAEKVKAGQGMGAWPVCSKKAGQTSSSPNSGSDSDSSEGSSSESSSSKSSSSEDSTPAKSSTESSSTAKSSAKSSSASRSVEQTAAPAAGGDYTVVAGDTLSAIASEQGVDGGAAGLADRNDIADPDVIAVGQTLDLG